MKHNFEISEDFWRPKYDFSYIKSHMSLIRFQKHTFLKNVQVLENTKSDYHSSDNLKTGCAISQR